MLVLLALTPVMMALTLPLLGAAGGISELEQDRFRRPLGLAGSAGLGLLAVKGALAGGILTALVCLVCAAAMAWLTEKRPSAPASGRPAQQTALLAALAIFSQLQAPAIGAAAIMVTCALLYMPSLRGLRRLTGTQAPYIPAQGLGVEQTPPPSTHAPESPAPALPALRQGAPAGGYQRTRTSQRPDLKPGSMPPLGSLPGERTRGT